MVDDGIIRAQSVLFKSNTEFLSTWDKFTDAYPELKEGKSVVLSTSELKHICQEVFEHGTREGIKQYKLEFNA